MKTYVFKAEQLLPAKMEDVWQFFSSAKKLPLITPPELDFKVLTSLKEEEIYNGMIIEYKVRPLLGIQVYWKTEICEVDKPHRFIDRQLKGPYKTWIHKHSFIETANGVLMKDEVDYELPFKIIGQLTHALIVKQKIEKIFNYRRQVLQKIFKQ